MKTLNESGKYKHQYELETNKGDVLINANNRAQARKLVESKGYNVHSVNMVG